MHLQEIINIHRTHHTWWRLLWPKERKKSNAITESHEGRQQQRIHTGFFIVCKCSSAQERHGLHVTPHRFGRVRRSLGESGVISFQPTLPASLNGEKRWGGGFNKAMHSKNTLRPRCHIEKCPCREEVSLSLPGSVALFQPWCSLGLAPSPVKQTICVMRIQTGPPFRTSAHISSYQQHLENFKLFMVFFCSNRLFEANQTLGYQHSPRCSRVRRPPASPLLSTFIKSSSVKGARVGAKKEKQRRSSYSGFLFALAFDGRLCCLSLALDDRFFLLQIIQPSDNLTSNSC